MNSLCTYAFMFIVFLMGQCHLYGNDGSDVLPQPVVNHNDAVQKQIRKMVSLVIDVENNKATEAETAKAFESLKSTAGVSEKELLMQLLIFKGKVNNDDSDQGRAVRVLIGVLYPQIPSGDLALFVVSNLEKAKNPVLIRNLTGVLDGVISKKSRKPDFSTLGFVLKKEKESPSNALVKYMYTKSPELTLSTMANVYLKKDEAKALMDKVKDKDEAKALDLLSKRSEWWVHLYVAEKMKKNPNLQSSALIEKLKKSKHPLVQEAIKDIEKQNKPK